MSFTDKVTDPPAMVAKARSQEDEALDRLEKLFKDTQRNITEAVEIFGTLSSEGVKRAKERFSMFVAGSVIDRMVAAAQSGYPEHMVLKAGAAINVGMWKLLEPEAKAIARNKTATVQLATGNPARPMELKTVESCTGPELSQAFRPDFKGQVPLEKQIKVPPVIEKKKFQVKGDLDDYEDVETLVASGTEYVVIKGSRGSVLKCPIKVLRNIIK